MLPNLKLSDPNFSDFSSIGVSDFQLTVSPCNMLPMQYAFHLLLLSSLNWKAIVCLCLAENDGKKIMNLKCIPTKKQKGTHPCDSIQNVNGGLDFDMNWL